MYLNNIYSEPSGLFKPVKFNNGLNIIYGIKNSDDPKKSLNSIGKSTFLDLIDFTLLSSYNKNHNKRLYKAKHIMSGYNIVLEFSIQDKKYIIKRTVDDPNYIEFGEINKETSFYPIKNLKKKLTELIFSRKKYDGSFNSEKWFRNLISFYIKIQKFKKAKFLDPIKYIPELTESQLNVYHFYLLGLDNSIPMKIWEKRVHQKGLRTTINEVSDYVEQKYGLPNLKQAQLETNKLKLDIKKLSDAIDKFELGEQYEDAEREANILTEKIKANLYQNYIDQNKLKSYTESFRLPTKLNNRRIKAMYNEIAEDLGLKIKKTLSEAIDFRKKLSESRKEFLEIEINKVQNHIKQRDAIINKLEKERAKIFYFLSAKEAITDLTEAFYNLNEKRNQLSDLESNTKLLSDLQKEINEIYSELVKLKNLSIDFTEQVYDYLMKFAENFDRIFKEIYINKGEESQFSVIGGTDKDSIFEIDISLPDMYGKGKNQGRTLIYDLAVMLFNSVNTNNFPKFLIHDGIFDGIDKAHFVSVCKFIDGIANSYKIQYITTINEEGTLDIKFGEEDFIDPDFIDRHSVLTLSPQDKLFNMDF